MLRHDELMQTDAGGTVMDETEIELRDVTQYLTPPPHSFTQRECLSIRWVRDYLSTTVRPRTSGFPAARFLR